MRPTGTLLESPASLHNNNFLAAGTVLLTCVYAVRVTVAVVVVISACVSPILPCREPLKFLCFCGAHILIYESGSTLSSSGFLIHTTASSTTIRLQLLGTIAPVGVN